MVKPYTGRTQLDTYSSVMDVKTKTKTKNKPMNESFYHRRSEGQP